jgi:hypothetical protein
MPAGDRTGPHGMGPMTGRGTGYCGGYDAPGWAHPGFAGRSAGRGGVGWRWRHWYAASGFPRRARQVAPPGWGYGEPYSAPSREQELNWLKGQAQWLNEQLEAIGRRIEELSEE